MSYIFMILGTALKIQTGKHLIHVLAKQKRSKSREFPFPKNSQNFDHLFG